MGACHFWGTARSTPPTSMISPSKKYLNLSQGSIRYSCPRSTTLEYIGSYLMRRSTCLAIFKIKANCILYLRGAWLLIRACRIFFRLIVRWLKIFSNLSLSFSAASRIKGLEIQKKKCLTLLTIYTTLQLRFMSSPLPVIAQNIKNRSICFPVSGRLKTQTNKRIVIVQSYLVISIKGIVISWLESLGRRIAGWNENWRRQKRNWWNSSWRKCKKTIATVLVRREICWCCCRGNGLISILT